MATAFTDSAPYYEDSGRREDDAVDGRYRALAPPAIAAAVLAAISPLAFFDSLLAMVPAAGVFLACRAWLRIRREPDVWTGLPLAVAGGLVSLACGIGGIGYQTYVYATEVPPGFQRVSYEVLQPDSRVLGEPIPPSALELNGVPVFIKGYIFPGSRQAGIQEFLLVRDKGECCFGGNPKITDRVLVELVDSQIDFSTSLTAVYGTLQVDPERRKGVYYQLVGAHAK